MRTRAALATLVVAATVVGAAGGLVARSHHDPVRLDGALANLLRASKDLGLAPASEPIAMNLGLSGRDPAGLNALLGRGQRVSDAEYSARFGPEPARVAGLMRRLTDRGLRPAWHAGSPLLAVDGTAARFSGLLGVEFHDYVAPNGRHFHAATSAPQPVAWMNGVITSIDGLDDYNRVRRNRPPVHAGVESVHPDHGITPDDMRGFYNIKALNSAGLDGRGQTVLFPDAAPDMRDLNLYADRYRLPPFDVTVKGDKTPASGGLELLEVTQDLDIVHAMAPAAKLIVYNTAPPTQSEADILQAFNRYNDDMVSDHLGSIVSESLGWCSLSWDKSGAEQLDSIFKRGAAEGITFMVSSGDEGGFGCVREDSDQHRIAAALPASDPWVTTTGGTTVFLSKEGTYFKETAWSNAVSENGTGGGNSTFFPRPDWQTGPGVDTPASNGMRQAPDVAALADENSAWDVAFKGEFKAAGAGTSASAPLWAGVVALINQDLKTKGMREAGFANRAIYDIGRRNDVLPGPPFHDITQGSNLVYPATQGWDYATGWGSPNAGALASAWEDYIQAGGP